MELKTIKEKLQRCYDEKGEIVKNIYKTQEGIKAIVNHNINVQLNVRGEHIELVYYKNKPLCVPEHILVDSDFVNSAYTFKEAEEILNRRKFKLDKNGVAIPIYDKVCTADLQKSIDRSSSRAKHNFYNYALSNKWEYFCTFTFADKETRLNKDMLYQEWRNFVIALRKNNPNVKLLGVYERFKNRDSGFHFHTLVGNCNLHLVPARNADTNEFIYSDSGAQIFNTTDWVKGFNTVVCISPESNQLQVVNYLAKYMTKESPAPYGCKRYMRTNNLDESFNYLYFKDNAEIEEMIKVLGLTLKKDGYVQYFTNG